MNSIVYNKYPIMIAPAGNPQLSSAQLQPPTPTIYLSTPSAWLWKCVYGEQIGLIMKTMKIGLIPSG